MGIPPPFSAALALGRLPKQLLCGDLGRYPSASCRTKLTPTLDHTQAAFHDFASLFRRFTPLGVIKIQTYRGTQRNTLSAAVSFDSKNSKRLKSSRGHKILPSTRPR